MFWLRLLRPLAFDSSDSDEREVVCCSVIEWPSSIQQRDRLSMTCLCLVLCSDFMSQPPFNSPVDDQTELVSSLSFGCSFGGLADAQTAKPVTAQIIASSDSNRPPSICGTIPGFPRLGPFVITNARPIGPPKYDEFPS